MPRPRTGLRPGGPLVSRAELKRREPLKQKTGLKSRAINASRPKMSPEEKDGRDVVRARSGGVCEACGDRRAAHWHHRKNRSQLGEWDPRNGMHVCVPCHAWIGDFPTSAGVLGWHLESHQDPTVEPLRYRGRWVVLGADSSAPTPTRVPNARRLAAVRTERRRAAA